MMKLFLIPMLILGGLVSATQVHAASAGDLVKCPDFSEVYYLAENGERYVFQNEHSFFSWYVDFDDIKHISCNDLANLPVGGVVHYREGTRLVKIPSVSKVYFVEPDGVLRPVKDEQQAITLFGENWADLVDDLSESFFPQYTIGEELNDGELPEGFLLASDDGDLFRVDDSGDIAEIDDLLDEDESQIFDDSARDLEELEHVLGVDLALTRLEDNLENIQQEVTALRKAIEILEDLVKEFEDIFDGEEDEIKAMDALEDAEEELLEATIRVLERQDKGEDITKALVLLDQAQDLFGEAETAFNQGEFALAEALADASEDAANEAREGSHSNSNDDESMDDESDDSGMDSPSDLDDSDEDADDSETDDSGMDSPSDLDDSDEDSSDDETDSLDDLTT